MRGYISGAISGNTRESRERKLQKFAEAEAYLLSRRIEPVNPLKVGACIEESCNPPIAPGQINSDQNAGTEEYSHTWSCYMRHDIVSLMSCQAIFMIPQWHCSRGANIEHKLAVDLGMEVCYLLEENLVLGAFALNKMGKRT